MDTSTQQGAGRSPQAFIYFWKHYGKDEKAGHLPSFRLHQNSSAMGRIRSGDIVWAFTRRTTDGAYVIVARFLVSDAGATPASDPEQSGKVVYRERPRWM